ncbi:MAG: vitamin B12-dependent ribonucleotide reductase [Gemmatimonadales bacterium]
MLDRLIESPRPQRAADLTANARTVLAKRYLIKDAAGRPVEDPEDLFWRVARTVAAPDARYGSPPEAVDARAHAFYELMASGRFLPNSPTLMNAGRPLGQLSACFVLPIDDELSNGRSGIYDTLRAMALIHQSGGGTGFSFSRIRPRGAMVRSTTGVASGPVSFMKLFDASTEVVKQGGTRRGANMGILRVDHPDILEFIACKEDLTQVVNFNISVAVTQAFMEAVDANETYELRDPGSGRVTGTLPAREVWDRMIDGAWRTGEPGVFFIDEANRYNPVPHLGPYEATNPCGEQNLLPYDVCNLGSLNVGAYVKDQTMDWEAFGRDIATATRFLDNVIDQNRFPLPEVEQLSRRIRRIGLGVMGFADALVRMEIPYDSVEGVEFGRQVMAFLDTEAKDASALLAKERGPFPEWAQSIWGPDATAARAEDGERVRPSAALRNCNVTTVAPTGTISIIAGCSSGLEPLFAVAFLRNQAGVMMPDVNADFVAIAKREGWYSDALVERIAKEGHIRLAEVPEKWQRVFVTANAIAPEWHIRMQAAFQAHCDSAISKTTNFAHTATREDVRAIYDLAYRSHCKGVTVYRDGSRDAQVLSTGATAEAAAARKGAHSADAPQVADLQAEVARLGAELARFREHAATAASETPALRMKRPRPEVLESTSIKQATPLGVMFVHVSRDQEGRPFDVFVNLGKAGGSAMADAEAMGRLISLGLRSGISIEAIHEQLRGISSDRAVGFGEQKVRSVPDGIAIALSKWQTLRAGVQAALPLQSTPVAGVPVMIGVALGDTPDTELNGACPDCGAEVRAASGCEECSVGCGYTACG